MLGRILRKLRRCLAPRLTRPPLTYPEGMRELEVRRWLGTVHPAGAPLVEMANYCREDFERFVRTWQMTAGLQGECLELGANPYFTTMLLRRFSPLRLTLANYFGARDIPVLPQEVCFEDWATGLPAQVTLPTHHFNVEKEPFPFGDEAFDVVLFCEILEHLLEDPLHVLREVQRVLKYDGTLILTTPNVARLENVARLLAGENIYDPYSGYGPYGRHNREYTLGELRALLEHAGYTIETAYAADVHENRANDYFPIARFGQLLRRGDLGQYLFVRARNKGNGKTKRPAWLFRSFC